MDEIFSRITFKKIKKASLRLALFRKFLQIQQNNLHTSLSLSVVFLPVNTTVLTVESTLKFAAFLRR